MMSVRNFRFEKEREFTSIVAKELWKCAVEALSISEGNTPLMITGS